MVENSRLVMKFVFTRTKTHHKRCVVFCPGTPNTIVKWAERSSLPLQQYRCLISDRVLKVSQFIKTLWFTLYCSLSSNNHYSPKYRNHHNLSQLTPPTAAYSILVRLLLVQYWNSSSSMLAIMENTPAVGANILPLYSQRGHKSSEITVNKYFSYAQLTLWKVSLTQNMFAHF